MVFSSLFFTFYFLPIVIALYFLAKEKYRNYILLAASIFFYSYGEPRFVFVMLGSIFINYIIAVFIDRSQGMPKGRLIAKLWLLADICLNLGILFVYKYLDFTISTVNTVFKTSIPLVGTALHIGISFFTFQALSYVIDVYRGKVKVQKNPLYLALYISFFPQLIAGPIVRYSTVEQQITNRTCSIDKFSEGARRFMLGFCKKVILANNLSEVVIRVFDKDASITNPVLLWLGSICFSLQIFYDFSGYSDMAIGLGKLFGFEFEENFNYPYICGSVTEFWRRWHISLSQWFRDYVYIPLGGSKVSVARHIFNLLVVWMLTGIWHGANYTFIVWGLGYFVLLVIEKYLIKPTQRKAPFRILWRITTLACVNFGWVLFNSPDLSYGIKYCLGMFDYYGVGFSYDAAMKYNISEYGFFIVVGIICATPVLKIAGERLRKTKAGVIQAVLEPLAYGVVFLWAVSFLILGAHNPFIYFNF